MEFKGKALFNMLRIQQRDGSLEETDSWKVEDYHSLPEEMLFNRLERFGIVLDAQSVRYYIEACSSPEEWSECLVTGDRDFAECQQIYLLLFELWRRYAPHKQSLSVFCDELDYIIERYEDGAADARERLYQALEELEDILDDSVDQGTDAKTAFATVKSYLCHDLEAFLYDFIAHLIDLGHATYPSELIDAFSEYFEDALWLDFLRVRLMASTDLQEAMFMLERVLDTLEEQPQFELYIEILRFLSYFGDSRQFVAVFEEALTLLKKEEHLDELLELAAEYFSTQDKVEEEREIRALLEQRAHIDKAKKVTTTSEGYHKLVALIISDVDHTIRKGVQSR